jgi:hypothetical protein
VRKLLEEEPRAEGGDDEWLACAWREALHGLLRHEVHGDLTPLWVAEAPKLASAAIALAKVRDRVVEEPLTVELRAAPAHVGELLLRLRMQLLERVVIRVL